MTDSWYGGWDLVGGEERAPITPGRTGGWRTRTYDTRDIRETDRTVTETPRDEAEARFYTSEDIIMVRDGQGPFYSQFGTGEIQILTENEWAAPIRNRFGGQHSFDIIITVTAFSRPNSTDTVSTTAGIFASDAEYAFGPELVASFPASAFQAVDYILYGGQHSPWYSEERADILRGQFLLVPMLNEEGEIEFSPRSTSSLSRLDVEIYRPNAPRQPHYLVYTMAGIVTV